MSKYKLGDKFVVEINEVMESNNGTLYRANFSTLVFDDYGLDNLSQLGEAKGTYEDGIAYAWEAAKKISNMNPQVCINVFTGNGCIEHVLQNISPQEAIARIKEWEDSEEIRRGDEMVHVMDGNVKVIVTYIAVDGDFIHGISRTGDLYSCSDPANWRKTGRNFAYKLDALLEEIGEGKNE